MSYRFCICKKSDNGGCDGGNVIPVDPKPPTCDDCLVGKTVRFNCNNSPSTCGGKLEVDLTLFAAINACNECDVEWGIKSYTDGISSASITQDGLLTLNAGSGTGEHEVVYTINCPCSLLSTTGCVVICLKDPCDGVSCPPGQKCDGCRGCVEATSDLSLTSSTDINSDSGISGGLTLT